MKTNVSDNDISDATLPPITKESSGLVAPKPRQKYIALR